MDQLIVRVELLEDDSQSMAQWNEVRVVGREGNRSIATLSLDRVIPYVQDRRLFLPSELEQTDIRTHDAIFTIVSSDQEFRLGEKVRVLFSGYKL